MCVSVYVVEHSFIHFYSAIATAMNVINIHFFAMLSNPSPAWLMRLLSVVLLPMYHSFVIKRNVNEQ